MTTKRKTRGGLLGKAGPVAPYRNPTPYKPGQGPRPTSTAPQVRTSIPYEPPPRPDPRHMTRDEAMAGHADREREIRALDTTSETERRRRASAEAARIAGTYPRRGG